MIKRVLSIVVWCAVLIPAGQSLAGTKMDPYFDLAGAKGASKAISLNSRAPQDSPSRETSIFIKSTDTQKTSEAVRSLGGSVQMVSGDIISATVSAEALEAIAEGDEVIFVEAAKPISLKNDVAGNEINSSDVHAGTELARAFTGRGVIVGLIDTGIDYRHPDFLDAEGKNRILAIWDQNRSGGSSPSEIEDSFGTECDEEAISSGSCPIRDLDGHGTHVAGTMASRNDTYGGVAPDANIIAVSYDSSLDLGSGYADTIFSTKICQAAYYVFAKAQALGLPAVVNLSLGTHIGAHDGSSLFEECLAGLVSGKAGRAIVAAAGNEYSTDETYTGVHAGFEVSGLSASNFVIRQLTRDRIYYIDIWVEAGSNLSAGLAIRDKTVSGVPMYYSGLISAGERKDGALGNTSVNYIINATETASALNGKQHIGITITLGSQMAQPGNYSFDLVLKGSGAFDAWLFPDKPSKTIQFTSISGNKGADWTYVSGDRVKSVAIPATSPGIIAVGAYTTRNKWSSEPGCCQVTYELGDLLDFSSSGPSAEPNSTGVKPNVTAPGGMVASTLSSDSTPNPLLVIGDKRHALQAGTSMAAPFVSGTVALMFSANPNFTSEDAMRYVTEGAYADESTGAIPNERWGFGKLDVLSTMELAMSGGPSGTFNASGAVSEPQQQGAGSPGRPSCSFVPTQDAGASSTAGAVVILLSGIVILIFLRRPSPCNQAGLVQRCP